MHHHSDLRWRRSNLQSSRPWQELLSPDDSVCWFSGNFFFFFFHRHQNAHFFNQNQGNGRVQQSSAAAVNVFFSSFQNKFPLDLFTRWPCLPVGYPALAIHNQLCGFFFLVFSVKGLHGPHFYKKSSKHTASVCYKNIYIYGCLSLVELPVNQWL
jgi:hypothetical protein